MRPVVRYRGLRGPPECNEGPYEARDSQSPPRRQKRRTCEHWGPPHDPAAASHYHIRQTGPSSRLHWAIHDTWWLIPGLSPVLRLLASSCRFHGNHYSRHVPVPHHETSTNHHPRQRWLSPQHQELNHHRHNKSLSNITASHHPKSTAVQCGPLLIANRALSKSSASSLAGRDLPLSRTPDTPVIIKQSRASGYKGTSAQSMRAWGGHTRDTYISRESGSASRDAGKKKSCLTSGTQSPSQSGWPYRAG